MTNEEAIALLDNCRTFRELDQLRGAYSPIDTTFGPRWPADIRAALRRAEVRLDPNASDTVRYTRISATKRALSRRTVHGPQQGPAANDAKVSEWAVSASVAALNL